MPEIAVVEPVPDDYSRGAKIPWRLKMTAKLVFARLPVSHDVWRKLGIFRLGRSDAVWTREKTFAAASLEMARQHLGRAPEAVLELGPGDSFATALCSAAAGVKKIWLVDVGDFATVDVEKYRALVEELDAAAPGFAARVDLSSREAMLRSINARYLTNGLAAFDEIETEIELALSLKVLEHISRADFHPLMTRLFGICRARSLQRHIVDLHDHLGCSLNNLRFPEAFWEHPLVSRSGFYTNRLRFSEIVQMSEDAGHTASVRHAYVWDRPPVRRAKLAPRFRDFSDADLKVCAFDLILAKGAQA
jgi:hypothetical protein